MNLGANEYQCRVCVSKDLLINIFTNKIHNIVQKLCFCASIQISENDGLPQHICTKCFADLETAYAFRKRCEENDAKLRATVSVPIKVEIFECLASNSDIESLEVENYPSVDNIESPEGTTSNPDSQPLRSDQYNALFEIDTELFDELDQASEKTSKTYTCETCEKVFTIRTDYFEHIRGHGNKRFQCETCSKWFSRKTVYTKHVLRHQGKVERVPCDQCSQDFNCRTALLRHIAGVHEGRRDFICTICGHGFAQKTGLQAHQSVHVGSQFKCNQCQATFKNLRFFLRHEQRHLPPEERDPKLMFISKSYNSSKSKNRIYVCTYCGKTSNNHTSHVFHERFHRDERPYPCKVCGKAFRRKTLVDKHMRTHTGERPHKCELCGKCFREKSHLTTHNLTHTQEKKHVCQICSKAFALKCTLKAHLKCHEVCEDTEVV